MATTSQILVVDLTHVRTPSEVDAAIAAQLATVPSTLDVVGVEISDMGFGQSAAVAVISLAPSGSNKVATKVWPFQTNSTTQYAGGFYDFFSGDDDFAAPVNFGTANTSVAAHFSVILGAATVDTLTIRVTGTSITDAGVQTGADTEDIVIPSGTGVDSYFETGKKWNGLVSVVVLSGTAVTCNYGWSKYHDFGNTDFRLLGLEALWESDSTDSGSDVQLLHHKATGWTFNSGASPTPPAPLAARSVDHIGNDVHRVGPGAWKRTGVDTLIAGIASEGILFCVTSGSTGIGSLSFRVMSLEVEIERV